MSYCTKCGAELREGDKFCTKCGNTINSVSNKPVIKKHKGKWPIVLGVVIALLVISALLNNYNRGNISSRSIGVNDYTEATSASKSKASVSEKSEVTDSRTTADEKTKTASSDRSKNVGGVTPELKEYLDSYEAFVDEYCEFCDAYSENKGDLTLLTQYFEMLEKVQDFEEKLEKYDEKEMSDADLKYYIEVTTRCSGKMLNAASKLY